MGIKEGSATAVYNAPTGVAGHACGK